MNWDVDFGWMLILLTNIDQPYPTYLSIFSRLKHATVTPLFSANQQRIQRGTPKVIGNAIAQEPERWLDMIS